jgi:hypothetical protein
MRRTAALGLMFWVMVIAVGAQQPAKLEVPINIAGTAAPLQPVPYSHKAHIALGLQCRQCHANPELGGPDPGGKMTFPSAATCMGCHKSVAKERPTIVKLAELAKSGQPIPWVRVYEVTQGVTWSHRKHLQAGMQCVMCHGQVAELDAMRQTTAVTSMASCISCHQTHRAKASCQTCHAWPGNE